ncbi:MAG: hypothetical protein AAF651_05580, partial [Cyanobacteria bacterium P01_C01_bin.73]
FMSKNSPQFSNCNMEHHAIVPGNAKVTSTGGLNLLSLAIATSGSIQHFGFSVLTRQPVE